MTSVSIAGARAERGALVAIWGSAMLVAALGATIGFMASPGINWGIWTAVAALGLALAARFGAGVTPEAAALLVVAVILAGGAAVTANPVFLALVLCGTTTLMAVALRLTAGTRAENVGLAQIITAPPRGAIACVGEAGRRAAEAIAATRAGRGVPAARGAVIAIPLVVIFALLLSQADPTFALVRDDLARELSRITLLPRAVFFLALGVLTLGAYGIALRAGDAPVTVAIPAARPAAARGGAATLGVTERAIVLGSVSGVFALFLLLQVAYLFGDPGAAAGSGMTYAEYARRGFGELTVAASMASALILVLERFAGGRLGGDADGAGKGELARGERLVRMLALVLIALVQLLLDSAYRRVTLYEQAYGFTASRLYAQTYMIVMSLALVALGYEVWGGIDARRLTRRVAVLGTGALIALTYWNHQAWIARQNLARWERTGKLDVAYLTGSLSPDALPTVAAALPRFGAADAARARACLALRYDGWRFGGDHWYEWNARMRAARRAVERLGIERDTRERSAKREACWKA
ncbi:MAG TPA: DUF4173 domain-containing protein [Gemmatimonadaceae bacterium]